MNTQTTSAPSIASGRYEHECDHGFCTVCGAVWPCWRAERAAREAASADPGRATALASVTALPVPRLSTIPFAA